jgi:hypothetical protein
MPPAVNRPREARPSPRIPPQPNRSPTTRTPARKHTCQPGTPRPPRPPHSRPHAEKRSRAVPTPRTTRQPRTAQSASPAAVTPPQQPQALRFRLSGETNGRQRQRRRRQAQVRVPPGPAQPPPRYPRSGSLSPNSRARAEMLCSGSA